MAKAVKHRKRAAPRTDIAAPPQQRICNIVPSKGTEADWSFADAQSAGALGAQMAAPLPTAVDLRAPWWSINDQGGSGSCVGWATADGVLRYHMVGAGRLDRDTLLSPRFIWMASKETDEYTTRPETFIEEAGTSLKAALDVVRNYGAVTMDILPFAGTTTFPGKGNEFYAAAARRKIASYFNPRREIGEWKKWLANTGPILAALSVDRTWQKAADTGGNLNTFLPNTQEGGHAVCIVGYTAEGRFIIRNSWGTSWGDNGFGYASPEYIAAAFYNEAYGITL